VKETVTGLIAGQVTENVAGAHTTGEKVTQGTSDANLEDAEMSLMSEDDKVAIAATIQEIAKPSLTRTKRKLSATTGSEVVGEDSSDGKGVEVKGKKKKKQAKGKGTQKDNDNADNSKAISISESPYSYC
jgi:hypothetical protein